MAQSNAPIANLKKPFEQAKSKINAILPKNVNLTAVEEKGLIKGNWKGAVARVISDCKPIYSSSQMVEYNPSTITSSQKATVGIDKIPAKWYSSFIRSGSTGIFNGTRGKVIFSGGKIYHFIEDDDFKKVVDLCNESLAYEFLNKGGTAKQKTAALSNYNKQKAKL